MSVNYAAEAAKLLQNAARHITEHPQDMRIAEVSALVGSGFASLAHLPEQQVIAHEHTEKVLRVVVDHAIRLATSWEPELRRKAHELMRDLDEAGVRIDDLVEARSAETGHGPRVCDMFGDRYDLTKQWIDRRGKRWEHTGSWSDVGGPVMRMDAPDGDSLVLSELIREYGPLHTVAKPPVSPVVDDVDVPF